jgi:hypothetical protein
MDIFGFYAFSNLHHPSQTRPEEYCTISGGNLNKKVANFALGWKGTGLEPGTILVAVYCLYTYNLW